MTQILVEPLNYDDFAPEEIEELVEKLQNLDSSYDVRIAHTGTGGAGPEWVELISIWLPWNAVVSGTAAGVASAVTTAAIDWLRSRPEKKSTRVTPQLQTVEETPTRVLHIYGPDGKVLQHVRVKSSGAEPEYEDTSSLKEHKRERPPIVDHWPPRNPGH